MNDNVLIEILTSVINLYKIKEYRKCIDTLKFLINEYHEIQLHIDENIDVNDRNVTINILMILNITLGRCLYQLWRIDKESYDLNQILQVYLFGYKYLIIMINQITRFSNKNNKYLYCYTPIYFEIASLYLLLGKYDECLVMFDLVKQIKQSKELLYLIEYNKVILLLITNRYYKITEKYNVLMLGPPITKLLADITTKNEYTDEVTSLLNQLIYNQDCNYPIYLPINIFNIFLSIELAIIQKKLNNLDVYSELLYQTFQIYTYSHKYYLSILPFDLLVNSRTYAKWKSNPQLFIQLGDYYKSEFNNMIAAECYKIAVELITADGWIMKMNEIKQTVNLILNQCECLYELLDYSNTESLAIQLYKMFPVDKLLLIRIAKYCRHMINYDDANEILTIYNNILNKTMILQKFTRIQVSIYISKKKYRKSIIINSFIRMCIHRNHYIAIYITNVSNNKLTKNLFTLLINHSLKSNRQIVISLYNKLNSACDIIINIFRYKYLRHQRHIFYYGLKLFQSFIRGYHCRLLYRLIFEYISYLNQSNDQSKSDSDVTTIINKECHLNMRLFHRYFSCGLSQSLGNSIEDYTSFQNVKNDDTITHNNTADYNINQSKSLVLTKRENYFINNSMDGSVSWYKNDLNYYETSKISKSKSSSTNDHINYLSIRKKLELLLNDTNFINLFEKNNISIFSCLSINQYNKSINNNELNKDTTIYYKWIPIPITSNNELHRLINTDHFVLTSPSINLSVCKRINCLFNSTDLIDCWLSMKSLLIYGTNIKSKGFELLLSNGVSHLKKLSFGYIGVKPHVCKELGKQISMSTTIISLYIDNESRLFNESINDFMKYLQRNKSLQLLSIRRCNLSTVAAQAISRFIPTANQLTSFILNDNNFTMSDIKLLIVSIANKGGKGRLQHVHLLNQNSSLTSSQVFELEKWNKQLGISINITTNIIKSAVCEYELEKLDDRNDKYNRVIKNAIVDLKHKYQIKYVHV